MSLDRDLSSRRREANRICTEAGRIALEYFEAPERLEVQQKAQQDWVTRADHAVEAFVREQLAVSFPGEGFLGEETGATGSKDAVWVCDPIDGTSNFMRGMPSFAVNLAFVHEDRVQVGVTREPAQDRSFTCQRGGGAWSDGARISVREDARPDSAIIGLGFSLRRDRRSFLSALDQIFDRGVEFRRIGSAAICLAYVASGRLDGFWQIHLNAWDVAPGLLLVEEAGGLVCDFFSQDGLTSGNPVLAGAPAVAEALSGPLSIPLRRRA